jgi:hypothetical protein
MKTSISRVFTLLGCLLLLIACKKENQEGNGNSVNSGKIKTITYERPSASIDTLSFIYDDKGRLTNGELISYNLANLRSICVTQFTYGTQDSMKLKLTKYQLDLKNNAYSEPIIKDYCFKLNLAGLICESCDGKFDIAVYQDGSINRIDPVEANYTVSFSERKAGNIDSIHDGTKGGNGLFMESSSKNFWYSAIINEQSIIQTMPTFWNNRYILPFNTIANFICPSNKYLVDSMSDTRWDGSVKHPLKWSTKYYYYNYEFDQSNKVKVINIVDKDNQVVLVERYTYY